MAVGFEPYVKWCVQAMFIVGAFVSGIAFSHWYAGVGVYLLLTMANAFLGKAIFQYALPFVQPFPNFDYRPSRWRAMGFAFPNHDPKRLAMFGPAFQSEAEICGIFDLFREWNDGSDEDNDDNICVSVIFENPGAYSVYIYPNTSRKPCASFLPRREGSWYQGFGGSNYMNTSCSS